MKIAVIGGAGFIGSNVVDKYIESGFEVVAIDNLSTGFRENVNPRAKFYEIDIRDREIEKIFEREKFDVVNHLAAQADVRVSVADPKFDADVNIIGSLNLYEAARKTGVKKIIFSSTGGAIYGEQDYFPADENHPLRPCSPYGVAKLANEKYLYYYKKEFGLDYVALRYGNVYGPRQNPFGEAGVVAIFANKMLSGEQPIINGDGTNTRDYVYVDDIVEGNALALDEKMSGCFNLATGKETDVNYIFRKLRELTGADVEEIHGEPKKGEQKRSVVSYEKIYREFGWRPRVDLDEGLRRVVEYFRENIKSSK